MAFIKNKRNLIIIIATLLLLGGVAGAFILKNKNKPSGIGPDGINYNPPTEAEKKETEQFKKDLEARTNNQTNNASSQANVTMTYLTYQDNKVSSAGFINNVFEDGGTCTLTLTKGSAKVSAASTGLQDVNKTTCPSISIERSKLQSGEWSAVLSYSSSTISGSSSARSINVP